GAVGGLRPAEAPVRPPADAAGARAPEAGEGSHASEEGSRGEGEAKRDDAHDATRSAGHEGGGREETDGGTAGQRRGAAAAGIQLRRGAGEAGAVSARRAGQSRGTGRRQCGLRGRSFELERQRDRPGRRGDEDLREQDATEGRRTERGRVTARSLPLAA